MDLENEGCEMEDLAKDVDSCEGSCLLLDDALDFRRFNVILV